MNQKSICKHTLPGPNLLMMQVAFDNQVLTPWRHQQNREVDIYAYHAESSQCTILHIDFGTSIIWNPVDLDKIRQTGTSVRTSTIRYKAVQDGTAFSPIGTSLYKTVQVSTRILRFGSGRYKSVQDFPNRYNLNLKTVQLEDGTVTIQYRDMIFPFQHRTSGFLPTYDIVGQTYDII